MKVINVKKGVLYMAITQTEIEHVAKLAKLDIPEERKQHVALKISSLLEYMRQLQELDITGIEPTTLVLPLTNVFREDKTTPCLPREEALSLAPESEDGYFKVPSIL